MSEIGTARERATFADPRDLDEFVEQLGRFERGEINAEEWRAFRLLQGTYGQRQEGDLHMVRTKLPQGVVTAAQLEALAEVTERWSRGFGHVSTRQNLQLHFVTGRGAEAALRRLAEVGVTSREACGNSVRNVTACPYGGVSADEVFDTTPYAEALTRHFLRHPLSSSLPRKFKIAFEGCREDHAAAAIHDLGFFARRQDGEPGFQVPRRRRHRHAAGLGAPARRVPPGRRAPRRRRGGDPRLPPAGRPEEPGRQPAQVPGAEARLRGLPAARWSWRARRRCAPEGVPPLGFDPLHPPEEGPPAGARPPAARARGARRPGARPGAARPGRGARGDAGPRAAARRRWPPSSGPTCGRSGRPASPW